MLNSTRDAELAIAKTSILSRERVYDQAVQLPFPNTIPI